MPSDANNVLGFRQRIAATVRGLRGDGQGLMFTIIAVGWLLILEVRFLVPALLPQVKSTFGVDNTTAGVAVTAVYAFYALTQFPAGLITDHVGERVALTVSLSVSAGSLVLLFGSPVFALFMIGAATFGIGSGI